MSHSLTLHPNAWLRDGPEVGTGEVTGYRVGGMQNGAWARIANFAAPSRNDWQIMRISADNNTQSDWTGHYETAQDALAALQKELM